MPLVPQIVDAVGDRVPVVAAGRHLRRARPGRGAGPRRRRRLGRDPLHRHPRGPRAWPATRRPSWPPAEDGTTVSRAYSGKTMRVLAQRLHRRTSTPTPTSCSAFPASWAALRRRGLPPRRPTTTTPGRPGTECYPAGQGVGGDHRARPGRRAGPPFRRRGRRPPSIALADRLTQTRDRRVAGRATRPPREVHARGRKVPRPAR